MDKYEKLNETFDVTPVEIEKVKSNDIDAKLANGILELAQESEMPRAYEVAGQLIKSVSDATDKLMDLQKKLKDVNKEEEKGPSSVTNNALFVGSTADLQKMLKKVNKDLNT